MDISALTAENKSIRLDTAGFQTRVAGLELRVATSEECLKSIPNRDQELLYLRSKVIDLVHWLGPMRLNPSMTPRLIIACLLSHEQAWKLIAAARSHGPYTHEGHELRIAADFSWETNDQRKAFLSIGSGSVKCT
ncbi:hypothetical protein NDU88_008120 [Pleurodeles waltl]|uniref:Uncharacterized protein n=1 Tax=Pleurodeles waltl TaxID=8319 RepID=A0AAV7N5M9_PLEWA|nr:hypothetical protein NDU88_008120 [Pleurodeles waltl]